MLCSLRYILSELKQHLEGTKRVLSSHHCLWTGACSVSRACLRTYHHVGIRFQEKNELFSLKGGKCPGNACGPNSSTYHSAGRSDFHLSPVPPALLHLQQEGSSFRRCLEILPQSGRILFQIWYVGSWLFTCVDAWNIKDIFLFLISFGCAKQHSD